MTLRDFAKKFDWWLLLSALLIGLAGLATFFAMGPSAHTILIRQGVFLCIATFVIFLFLFLTIAYSKILQLPQLFSMFSPSYFWRLSWRHARFVVPAPGFNSSASGSSLQSLPNLPPSFSWRNISLRNMFKSIALRI